MLGVLKVNEICNIMYICKLTDYFLKASKLNTTPCEKMEIKT